MDTFDLDVTDGGPEPSGRTGEEPMEDDDRPTRAGRWRSAWLVVPVVLAVVAAVWFGYDQHAHDRETRALLGGVTAGQASIVYTDAQILSIVDYTSPQLLSARAPERVRASLRSLVQQTAARRIGPLKQRRDAVAAVRIEPWHGRLRRARTDYLAYLDERIAYVRAISVEFRTLYRPPPTTARRDAARESLLSAVPDRSTQKQIRTLLP